MRCYISSIIAYLHKSATNYKKKNSLHQPVTKNIYGEDSEIMPQSLSPHTDFQ